jgi:hypothetical protein
VGFFWPLRFAKMENLCFQTFYCGLF